MDREVGPVTAATIADAKAANRTERIRAIAHLLASFDDVEFRTATAQVRAIYVNAAGAAIDAAHRERLFL